MQISNTINLYKQCFLTEVKSFDLWHPHANSAYVLSVNMLSGKFLCETCCDLSNYISSHKKYTNLDIDPGVQSDSYLLIG